MTMLENTIRTELIRLGADMVGFGSLEELPDDVRGGLPVGISVAVSYPKEVIRGIGKFPTHEYYEWYCLLNERLDAMVGRGAEILREMGYKAIALTREYVGSGELKDFTTLPYKTVATRAGIGWIGKCALLVTEKFGSAIRLSSILTDAPLSAAIPVNESRCSDCMICADVCPGGAVSGKLWEAGIPREEFFDAVKCRRTARERTQQNLGLDITICGKCIEACPYTRQYLYSSQ